MFSWYDSANNEIKKKKKKKKKKKRINGRNMKRILSITFKCYDSFQRIEPRTQLFFTLYVIYVI